MSALDTSSVLAAVLEASSDGIAVVDAGGFLVLANGLFLDAVGYEREEIVGLHLRSLLPGAEHLMTLADDGPTPWSGEVEMMTRGDASLAVPAAVTLAKDIWGMTVGVIVLIGSAYGREASASAALEVTPFQVRRLDHKLRNVLMIIASNLELLNRVEVDPKVRQRLAFIQSATDSGLELVHGA